MGIRFYRNASILPLAAVFAASWHLNASAPFSNSDIIFAKAKIGPWIVEAGSTPDRIGSKIKIRDIGCFGQNANATISRSLTGQTSLVFRDRDGLRHDTLNIDLIMVGGREYASKAVSSITPDEYENLRHSEDCPEGGCIILPIFRGYLAVQAKPGVWLPVNSLLKEILDSKRVSLRYRKMNDDCGGRDGCSISDPRSYHSWKENWIRADMSALADVIRWCDKATKSPAALMYRESANQGRP